MAAKRLNIRRECQHGGRHKHGTPRMYRADRCRCPECTDAKYLHDSWITKQKAYGRYGASSKFVDAVPVRAHLESLRAAGMGYRRVAAMVGLPAVSVFRIEHRHNGYPPSRKVLRSTADAILAVRPDIAAGANVDAAGTRRRVQALVACGWSYAEISARMGRPYGDRVHVRRFTFATAVTRRTRDEVAVVFDRMWDVRPPAASSRERATRTRMMRIAAAAGWLPPLAWDDDSIDDPAAIPAGRMPHGPACAACTHESCQQIRPPLDEVLVARIMAGTHQARRQVPTSPELVAAVRRLAGLGLSDGEIGGRVGRSKDAVLKVRERATPPIPAGVSPGRRTA